MSGLIRIVIPKDQIAQLNDAMMKSAVLLKKNCRQIVIETAKGLTKELIKATPPFNNRSTESTESTKTIGVNAVTRDINKAVTIFADSGLSSKQSFIKRIKAIEQSKDKEAMEAILRNVPKMNKWQVKDFDPTLHTSKRNEGDRFRIRESQHILTLDVQKDKRYVKSVQDRVGRLKASWLPAAILLGVKVPQWIMRHSGWCDKVGKVTAKLDGNSPKITIFNGSKPFKYLYDAAVRAINERVDSMKKNIEFQLKNFGRK